MNLTLTKTRLKGAQTGHSLLAKKRDALTTRFRQILKKVDEVGVCALIIVGAAKLPLSQSPDILFRSRIIPLAPWA